MRSRRWIQTFAGVAIVGLSVAAQATASLPGGWYLEGNVGTSRSSNVSYGAGTSTSNNGLGWNVNLGYKFIPYFGAEVGYTSYSDAYGKYAGTKVADDSHYALDIAGKGILPLSDSGAELFAKFGLARIRSHITQENPAYIAANGLNIPTGTHTANSYYMGLGADYAFMPNFLVNLQWARAKGDSTTGRLDLYSIGAAYIFS